MSLLSKILVWIGLLFVALVWLVTSWITGTPIPPMSMSAQGVSTMPIDQFILLTVAQVIAWLVSGGIATLVNYVLGYFPTIPANVRNVISGVVIVMLVAGVNFLAASLSPAQLGMTVLQVAIAAVTFLLTFVASLFGLIKGSLARQQALALKLAK